MSKDDMKPIGWTWSKGDRVPSPPRRYFSDNWKPTDMAVTLGIVTIPERVYAESEVMKALAHKDRVIAELQTRVDKLSGILSGDIDLKATPEEREVWRMSAVRYADKVLAELKVKDRVIKLLKTIKSTCPGDHLTCDCPGRGKPTDEFTCGMCRVKWAEQEVEKGGPA